MRAQVLKEIVIKAAVGLEQGLKLIQQQDQEDVIIAQVGKDVFL